MHYLFEFGHTPSLAHKELTSVLLRLGVKFQKQSLSDQIWILKTKQQLDIPILQTQLAGVLRIGIFEERLKIAGDVDTVKNDVAVVLGHKLKRLASDTGSVTFSIVSAIEKVSFLDILSDIKSTLRKSDISSRYIEVKSGFTPPIQMYAGVVEFIVVQEFPGSISIFRTIDFSDVKDWQFRDRKRPFVDGESGVMPPKVARMLVNIGLENQSFEEPVVFWDAFCGSGTIVMEALLADCVSYGSDINDKAVCDTQKNLEWLESEYHLPQWKVFEADATSQDLQTIQACKANLIICEGYLGPSRFDDTQLPEIITELTNLYTKALPNLRRSLQDGGRLIFALPQFYHSQSATMHKKIIDTCLESGYTLSVKPIIYGRATARVKRLIYILDTSKH